MSRFDCGDAVWNQGSFGMRFEREAADQACLKSALADVSDACRGGVGASYGQLIAIPAVMGLE